MTKIYTEGRLLFLTYITTNQDKEASYHHDGIKWLTLKETILVPQL